MGPLTMYSLNSQKGSVLSLSDLPAPFVKTLDEYLLISL